MSARETAFDRVVEKHSRKAKGRRQYHARIRHPNGKTIWRLSEGYNNAAERDAAIDMLNLGGKTLVVDLDKPKPPRYDVEEPQG